MTTLSKMAPHFPSRYSLMCQKLRLKTHIPKIQKIPEPQKILKIQKSSSPVPDEKSPESENQEPRTKAHGNCDNDEEYEKWSNEKKRVTSRAFEVIFDDTGSRTAQEILDHVTNLKYNSWGAFAQKHVKNGESHVHVGIILRDKPHDRSFTWGHPLMNYFTLAKHGLPPMVRPLRSNSNKMGAKLQMYYDYTNDEARHDGEDISDKAFHRWEPELKINGTNLTKCSTKEYVFTLYKQGQSFRQIIEEATNKNQADIMYNFGPIKKMLYNWDQYMNNKTITREITEFKSAVVEHVSKHWKKDTSLILKGPSNMGKTELAKSILLNRTGIKPIFCRNLNKLAFRESKQPIVYDDMNFAAISRSKTIALLDIENDSDLRILYGIHTVEAYCPQVFTTNEEAYDLLSNTNDEAISRRISFIDLTEFGVLYNGPQKKNNAI